MKTLAALFLMLALAFSASSLSATIQPPKGHYKKAYDATFILYGSSHVPDEVVNHPMCTATSFQKVQGGYLLLSAGHCTKETQPDELPADLTYSVSSDIGTPVYPVRLLKAVLDEKTNLDFSVFFFPTALKFPVIPLGDESTEAVGNATYNFNFSRGVIKMFTRGVVAAPQVTEGEVKNLWLNDQFAAGGASGSAVISEKTHKIIGIVSYGWENRVMPEGIVPISLVRLELLKSPIVLVHDVPLPCPKGRQCINSEVK